MDKAGNTEAKELEAKAPVQSPRQRLLSEIGQKLVLARKARDEQLSVVVRKLKLRKFHLQALETGNWDCLPDDVYALGFLRQYSSYLALDLEDEIQSIKHDQYILTRPLTFPDPPVAPSYKWAWIAGTAFIILFVTFNILNQDAIHDMLITATTDPLKAEQTASPTEDVSLADNASKENNPASDIPKETATEPTRETENISISSTPKILPEAKLPTINNSLHEPKTKTRTAPVEEVTAQPAIIDLNAKPPMPVESEETVELTDNKSATVHHFIFEAVTASVWLQVFLPDEAGKGKGKLYKEVLLQKGHHSSIKAAVDSLWITSGNPAAMRIKVDGRVQAKVGSLGNIGKVLRNYHFKVARQGNN
jgi:cytoskeletal protein RodZ